MMFFSKTSHPAAGDRQTDKLEYIVVAESPLPIVLGGA